MTPKPLATASVLLALGIPLVALAADGRPPRPPPEAIEACEGLSAGEGCAFTSPRGEVQGTCWRPDDSKPLACRPEGAPPPTGES